MKIKKLLPRHLAPVTRQNASTGSVETGAIAPATQCDIITRQCTPFAGDDAE